jgi:phage shock protein PspC (stress-responsive transcriptional regulator)
LAGVYRGQGAQGKGETSSRPRRRGAAQGNFRSRRHRLIAGVCGGIAQRLGWSPLLVRILFVLGAVLPIFPGAVVYVVLWLVLPKAEA